MNFKDFKKTHEDDKSVIMTHKKGHSVKIALHALSKEEKERLKKIPIEKPLKMADGGEATQDQSSQDQPAPPVTVNVNTQPNQSSAQPASSPTVENTGVNPSDYDNAEDYTKAVTGMNPNISQGNAEAQWYISQKAAKDQAAAKEPQKDESFADVNQRLAQNPTSPATNVLSTGAVPQSSAPEASAPAPAPEAPAQSDASQQEAQAATSAPAPQPQVQAPVAPPTPAQAVKQDLTAQDQAWQNDLNNGHITPETYSSLFAKKDTLGKVGTIFGLMLSGAGAGLTHQPNALLAMMDKQISNDLEAQKQSKANAQNFINLNQQHQLQQAQIGQMGIDTKTKAYALAQAQMLQASYHSLVQKTNAMPEGPQKEAAKQQLGIMYMGIKDKINNINDQAAGAAAYQNMLFGGQNGPSGDEEQSFQRQMSGMRMLGPQGEERAKDMESKHMPGLQGRASVPLSPSDRDAIVAGQTFQDQLKRFRDFAKENSGSLDYSKIQEGKALAANLASAYRQASAGGVYKASEQQFINNLIDPDPTKFLNNYRVLPKLDAVLKDSKSQLDHLEQSKGFPAQKESESTQESPSIKTMNGVQYKKVSGGWQRVK